MLDEVILYELNKLSKHRNKFKNFPPISKEVEEKYPDLVKLPRSRDEAKRIGAKYYFTGKPCKKNGHIAKKLTSNNGCILCIKKKRQEKNKIQPVDRNNLDNCENLLIYPATRAEARQIGSPCYFTGRPCINGHIDKRFTCNKICRSCDNNQRAKARDQDREKYRKQKREYRRKRLKDPFFRLNARISHAIRISLKKGKSGKSWTKYVKFTLQELIEHLEKQFRDGMTWENYGWYWHLDHIKPISLCGNDFNEAWALENLQPLLAQENLEKSNKYIGSPNNRIYIADYIPGSFKKFDSPLEND